MPITTNMENFSTVNIIHQMKITINMIIPYLIPVTIQCRHNLESHSTVNIIYYYTPVHQLAYLRHSSLEDEIRDR